MTAQQTYLVSIKGKDQVGVISGVTGCLFDAGANLADSSFSVLGRGFEFSAVASFAGAFEMGELEAALSALPVLEGARIDIMPFDFGAVRGENATITHVVEITGGDRPGLVARISEVLMDYNANVVRMSSKTAVADDGSARYRTRFAINAEAARFDAMASAITNTAGSLRLNCTIEAV